MEYEEHAVPIIQFADNVMENKFPLLGYGMRELEGASRWNYDPVLRVVAPGTFYARIRYLDVDEVGDSKIVWEPSRFSWAYGLGMAYKLTGNSRYADKFGELAQDWFDKNPYPMGIHFCSALELGIRTYAWIWAMDFFRDYVSRNPALLNSLLYGIWVSCRHIENNLSYYFAPNTHLLGEAFALYAAGAAFPEFGESRRWRELGCTILKEESAKQFYSDGTHRELSSCYHLYATDYYLQAVLIARQTGIHIAPEIETTARRAARRMAQLVPSSLQLPQFNDCDGGRLTWFCQQSLDATPSLVAAQILWGGPSTHIPNEPRNGYHRWMCPNHESVSHTTDRSAVNINNDADIGSYSESIPDSGITAYRNKADDYLLFRAGPFGYMDCGHSHDAPLSIILDLGGQPVIVDSGTGAYTKSREIRDRFRSAHGKNTILLNQRGPSTPADWFSWDQRTDARLTVAHETETGFVCQGSHDGFSNVLDFSTKVTRDIAVLDSGVVVIADRWQAEKPVECEVRFTLSPCWRFDQETGVLENNDRQLLHLFSISGQTIRSSHGAVSSNLPKTALGPYSPGYGVLSETQTLSWAHKRSHSGLGITIFSRVGEITVSSTSDGYWVNVGAIRFLINQENGPDSCLQVKCIDPPAGIDRGTH